MKARNGASNFAHTSEYVGTMCPTSISVAFHYDDALEPTRTCRRAVNFRYGRRDLAAQRPTRRIDGFVNVDEGPNVRRVRCSPRDGVCKKSMLMVGRTKVAGESIVPIVPAREAVVTWNARVSAGSIELRLGACDGRVSDWLPYVRFDAAGRRSFASRDTFVRIDTDVVRSSVDLVTVGVRTTSRVDAIFVSTPSHGARASSAALPAVQLEVPGYAQYVRGYEEERGWCAPATLAMLLAFHGHPLRVDAVAREVFDSDYRGTGNWAFNMAFAATLGLRAAVVHLRDLSHAHAFLRCGLPLGLSIAWAQHELPGAPLPESSGHLVVLRGIGADGTVIANDPAQPAVSVQYPRAEFERAWISHGGIALAIAPASRESTLLQLANA